jgi:hypothetical protein
VSRRWIVAIALAQIAAGVAIATACRELQRQLRSTSLLQKQMEEDHAMLVHSTIRANNLVIDLVKARRAYG